MKVFKHIGMLLISLLLLASCGSKQDTDKIVVVSREEGSGTRGAFIELLKIEEKNSDGVKVDHTTLSAVTTNSTAIMLTTVANDKVAIGHSSLGALNKTVKTVTIDGASATVENIKSGQYKIARSFNIVTLATVSPETQDFINYILSQDGQAVVEKPVIFQLTTPNHIKP